VENMIYNSSELRKLQLEELTKWYLQEHQRIWSEFPEQVKKIPFSFFRKNLFVDVEKRISIIKFVLLIVALARKKDYFVKQNVLVPQKSIHLLDCCVVTINYQLQQKNHYFNKSANFQLTQKKLSFD
jgi:hypothetical protein